MNKQLIKLSMIFMFLFYCGINNIEDDIVENTAIQEQPERTTSESENANTRQYSVQNSVVKDLDGQYIWQQQENDQKVTWSQALNACEALSLIGVKGANKGDWRLPSKSELETLLDRKFKEPMINSAYFPDAKSEVYWTSTTLKQDENTVWAIDFRNGNLTNYLKSDLAFVRCVKDMVTNLDTSHPDNLSLLGQADDYVRLNETGSPVYNKRKIRLKIAAQDDTILTSFCLKEQNSVTEEDECWRNVQKPGQTYSKIINYDLNGPEGEISLYLWFKDKENISNNVQLKVYLELDDDKSPEISEVKLGEEKNNSIPVTIIASDNKKLISFCVIENLSKISVERPDENSCYFFPEYLQGTNINYTINMPLLSYGNIDYTIWVKDEAGNITTYPNPVTFLRSDMTPPEIKVFSSGDKSELSVSSSDIKLEISIQEAESNIDRFCIIESSEKLSTLKTQSCRDLLEKTVSRKSFFNDNFSYHLSNIKPEQTVYLYILVFNESGIANILTEAGLKIYMEKEAIVNNTIISEFTVSNVTAGTDILYSVTAMDNDLYCLKEFCLLLNIDNIEGCNWVSIPEDKKNLFQQNPLKDGKFKISTTPENPFEISDSRQNTLYFYVKDLNDLIAKKESTSFIYNPAGFFPNISFKTNPLSTGSDSINITVSDNFENLKKTDPNFSYFFCFSKTEKCNNLKDWKSRADQTQTGNEFNFTYIFHDSPPETKIWLSLKKDISGIFLLKLLPPMDIKFQQ